MQNGAAVPFFQFGTYNLTAGVTADLFVQHHVLKQENSELTARLIAADNELQKEKDSFMAEFGVMANNMHKKLKEAECARAIAENELSLAQQRMVQLTDELVEARMSEQTAMHKASDAGKLPVPKKAPVGPADDRQPQQLKHLKEALARHEKEKLVLKNEKESLDFMLDNANCQFKGLKLVADHHAVQNKRLKFVVKVLASEVVKTFDAMAIVSAMRLYLEVETQKMQLANVQGPDALCNKAVAFIASYKKGALNSVIERTVAASLEKRDTDPTGVYALALDTLQHFAE
jgi:hypothetical protein